MIQPVINFFSSSLECISRTKEQRAFEEELFLNGLKKEQLRIIQKINQTINSEDLAVKFVLQELDVAREGDAFSQNFVKRSGFHLAQYLGALKLFKEDKKEIGEIQIIFLNFLNKIANEKIMFQTAMTILDGVMEHWVIGKYSEEGKLFAQDQEIQERVPLKVPIEKRTIVDSFKFYMKKMQTVAIEKRIPVDSFKLYIKKIQKVVMEKLVYADDKIQEVLDTFSMPKEGKLKEEAMSSSVKPSQPTDTITKEEEAPQATVKIYTEEKVNELMEKYSHIIEDIITGDINPKNNEAIETFQEDISLAAEEGNNLASVFCAFFEPESYFQNLPLPITVMDDKSKTFFIQILNTFEEKGFSESLEYYLQENRDNVYALATANDKFMQYLIAFWYVWENEDENKAIQEELIWYNQSALNGFEPAIKKMKEKGEREGS